MCKKDTGMGLSKCKRFQEHNPVDWSKILKLIIHALARWFGHEYRLFLPIFFPPLSHEHKILRELVEEKWC